MALRNREIPHLAATATKSSLTAMRARDILEIVFNPMIIVKSACVISAAAK